MHTSYKTTFKTAALLAAIFLTSISCDAQLIAGRRDQNAELSSPINSEQLLADIKYLASDELEGRSADRPSIQKTRAFIEKRFRESDLMPLGNSYRQEFTITMRSGETHPGVNFVGYVKGKKHPDKYIVVTAHYDHEGVKGGEIYNGADDNASGTAALFAIAAAFKKEPADHSLIFVAFDAEERGHQGSRNFVAKLPVPKQSILLNVNMDMLSRNDKGELYAAGAYHYLQLRPILEEARKKAKVNLLLGHDDPKLGRDDWTGQSDHAAFHRAGIPFVYFGVEDHADYHRPTDDFANIHPEFYMKAVETILFAIHILDQRLGR